VDCTRLCGKLSHTFISLTRLLLCLNHLFRFLSVYSMVDEGKVDASDVCVFEMTERVGGRLMSLRGLGPDGDLTVDAGGYHTICIRQLSFMLILYVE
jgi:hypothetical protein